MVNKNFGMCAAALCSMTACATPRLAPPQLRDARTAMSDARSSESSEYVLADLHLAQKSLDKAEDAWKAKEQDDRVEDLAYVAQRKAELARVRGENAARVNQQKTAQKKVINHVVAQSEERREQIADLKNELTEARATRDAEAQKANEGEKQEVRAKEVFATGSVQFASNSFDLSRTAQGQLDELVDRLQEASNRQLFIDGFSDATGRDETNAHLSQRRAERVMEYLVNKGVSPKEISVQGRGAQSAVADNRSPEGRASNRRAEIVVHAEATQAVD